MFLRSSIGFWAKSPKLRSGSEGCNFLRLQISGVTMGSLITNVGNRGDIRRLAEPLARLRVATVAEQIGAILHSHQQMRDQRQ